MRLVYEKTGVEVKVGDEVTLRDGDKYKVKFFREPRSPASEGKISLGNDDFGPEYYVSVIGAKWIEREDRAVLLDNWSVTDAGRRDPYQPPQFTQIPCLQGIVEGHPEHQDGAPVRTSMIEKVWVKDGVEFVLTANTVYYLGKTDPAWNKMYPDARARFLKAWIERELRAIDA